MSVIIARTIIIYLLLLLLLRILGKRQLRELEISEFVLALLASDMAANPLQNTETPLINGIVPVLLIFCFEILLVFFGLKSQKFREILYGRPSILIKNGQISPSELRKNRLSCEELLSQLRQQGCAEPSELQYAVLERDGSLSIFYKSAKRPPNLEELSISAPETELKRTLISNGRVDTRKLKDLGFDEIWLKKKLKEYNISGPDKLFFLAADSKGSIYYVLEGAE